MNDYNDILFINENGSIDQKTYLVINTEVFIKHVLVQDDSMQIFDGSIKILPSIYLCPISFTGKYRRSLKSISIHWFSGSWLDEEHKKYSRLD